MSKITLNSVADLTQSSTAQTTINTNSSTVQTAFDNTLSRDGTSPNQMGSTLDMNSNQIINLPTPTTQNSPARLIDVVSNPTIVIPGTGTSGHVVPFLDGNNTWSGTDTFSNTTTFNGASTFNGTVSLPANTVTGANTQTNTLTNLQLSQMPANTLKGNNTGGAANVADLTVAQVNTMLGVSALLPSNNIWTGTNTYNANVFFKGPLPWADVRAYGAVGNNSNDDTLAIQTAINAVYATSGSGGIVFLPQGNYKTTSTLTIKGSVRLVGASTFSTNITANFNGTTILFDSTCVAGSGMDNLFINGYFGASPTSPCILVSNGPCKCTIRECYCWGGTSGLQTGGVDCHFNNCFFAGNTNGVSSTGTAWYVRCIMDNVPGLGPLTNGYLRNGYFTGATGEDHFVMCDFSGSFTNSINLAAGPNITTFMGCVMSSPIVQSAGNSMFTCCEIAGPVTVGTNTAIFTGNYGLSSFTISGAGKVLAGNFNIT